MSIIFMLFVLFFPQAQAQAQTGNAVEISCKGDVASVDLHKVGYGRAYQIGKEFQDVVLRCYDDDSFSKPDFRHQTACVFWSGVFNHDPAKFCARLRSFNRKSSVLEDWLRKN